MFITFLISLQAFRPARIQSQVRLSMINSRPSGTEADFIRVLRFLLPILIPPTAPSSLNILSSTLYSPDNDSLVKFPT
jgi:hypothetical protein